MHVSQISRRLLIGTILVALWGLTMAPGVSAGNHQITMCNSANLHPTQTNLGTIPVNQFYSLQFTITPPNSPVGYFWSATPGPVLFPGVTLSPFQVFWSPNTAIASGTPTQIGPFTFTMNVGAILTPGAICLFSQTYTIEVV